MALGDIRRVDVEEAMKVFDSYPLEDLLKTYGGGKSTRWYVAAKQGRYDQKLILQMAHMLSRKVRLRSFKARDAKRHVDR